VFFFIAVCLCIRLSNKNFGKIYFKKTPDKEHLCSDGGYTCIKAC
jgi:hypothetical protein